MVATDVDSQEQLTRADLMPTWRSSLKSLFGKAAITEPWQKSNQDSTKIAPPASRVNRPALAVRGLPVVATKPTGQQRERVEKSAAVVIHVSEQDDEHTSPTSSKRSHSDMDIENPVTVAAAAKTQRRSPHALQRRIEIIEIDDSD